MVNTYDATTMDQTIRHTHDSQVSADDVRIEFINDRYEPENGIDANLIVDFVSIAGTVYQTGDPSTEVRLRKRRPRDEVVVFRFSVWFQLETQIWRQVPTLLYVISLLFDFFQGAIVAFLDGVLLRL